LPRALPARLRGGGANLFLDVFTGKRGFVLELVNDSLFVDSELPGVRTQKCQSIGFARPQFDVHVFKSFEEFTPDADSVSDLVQRPPTLASRLREFPTRTPRRVKLRRRSDRRLTLRATFDCFGRGLRIGGRGLQH